METIATPAAESQPTTKAPELHFVETTIDSSTFRGLVKEVSGRTITSKQASNLLEVFGQDLEVAITRTVRGFVAKHFGKKSDTTS